MNIDEKIHKQLCSFYSKNYRKPDYLYLGSEEHTELLVVTNYYAQYATYLKRGCLMFKGLEVVEVKCKNHLNFGFKD